MNKWENVCLFVYFFFILGPIFRGKFKYPPVLPYGPVYESGQFTLLSIQLIRYSWGHISGSQFKKKKKVLCSLQGHTTLLLSSLHCFLTFCVYTLIHFHELKWTSLWPRCVQWLVIFIYIPGWFQHTPKVVPGACAPFPPS